MMIPTRLVLVLEGGWQIVWIWRPAFVFIAVLLMNTMSSIPESTRESKADWKCIGLTRL